MYSKQQNKKTPFLNQWSFSKREIIEITSLLYPMPYSLFLVSSILILPPKSGMGAAGLVTMTCTCVI